MKNQLLTTDKKKPETLAESYARKVQAKQRSRSGKPSEERLSRSTSPLGHRDIADREDRVRLSKETNVTGAAGCSRFRSKSSDKRDHSLRSAVGKDDLMPRYKYKVEGRKRNQVGHQPPVSLLTYLAPPQGNGLKLR